MRHVFLNDPELNIKCFSPSLQMGGIPARNDGVRAQTYLDFAVEDMQDESIRGRVNALGNCKRAIHLAIDDALAAYGLLHHNANSDFPKKLEILEKASLLPISVFRRLNIDRNVMEHEYVVPKEQRT